MNGLLIRVGADLTPAGGSWNGPLDSQSGDFVYVPIVETAPVRRGLEKPFSALTDRLAKFKVTLPAHLRGLNMHLDPDFQHLTYGDVNERARQIRAHLGPDDFAVFYGALRDIRGLGLVYAIVGFFVVDKIISAVDVPEADWDTNAHSRRVLSPTSTDVVIVGKKEVSGRLERCIPIGEYRNRAYRVREDILSQWGGLSVKDGFLQRSGRLPRFLNPTRFLEWFQAQRSELIQANN
ncbi:MAG TPA: hypothetical protein VFX19_00775 [Dehalococcoidia bacterium]|nr:hypothetical protein [Dehalococcoidia bacterium]